MAGPRIGGAATAATDPEMSGMMGGAQPAEPAGRIPDQPMSDWDAHEAGLLDDPDYGFDDEEATGDDPDAEGEGEEEEAQPVDASTAAIEKLVAAITAGQQAQAAQQQPQQRQAEVPTFDDLDLPAPPEGVEISPETQQYMRSAIASGIRRGVEYVNQTLPNTLAMQGQQVQQTTMRAVECALAFREHAAPVMALPHAAKIAVSVEATKDPKWSTADPAAQAKILMRSAKALGLLSGQTDQSERGARRTSAARAGARAAGAPASSRDANQREIDSMVKRAGPGRRVAL